LTPDSVLEDLGGHGLAFVFNGPVPGPTVLLRCELDALPIAESGRSDCSSVRPGLSHQCGHDGHMAILAAVGMELAAARPRAGRVVLLYQPAEETGRGAAAVLSDPRFNEIAPDFAFALHNLPGFQLGRVVVREGAYSSASRGMSIRLTGATAHAAQPETGRSPASAVAHIIEALSARPSEAAPEDTATFATVVGARLGEKAFGTAPGHAEVWATLRSGADETMDRLTAHAEGLVRRIAAEHRLEVEYHYEDIFGAVVNSRRAVDIVRRAAGSGAVEEPDEPFSWSEDFGALASVASEIALFGLGAGTDAADLHHPDYLFPDELLAVGRDLFAGIIRESSV
jgi:amidohydrolase